MRPGELNHLITVRKWLDVPNGLLGLDQTFDAGVQHYAKREAVGGGMYWGTKQTGEEITHRFYLRYNALTASGQITGEHVIELDNHRYRVMRVAENDDRGEYVKIEVKDLGQIA